MAATGAGGDRPVRRRQTAEPALPLPTHHLPGTPGKVAVMAARERRGECLFHAEDAGMPDQLHFELVLGKNGAVRRGRLLRQQQGAITPGCEAVVSPSGIVSETVPGQPAVSVAPPRPIKPCMRVKRGQTECLERADYRAREAARKRATRLAKRAARKPT